ncbi:BtpA/SgcQ family protein [Patescibacteria group bacterium]
MENKFSKIFSKDKKIVIGAIHFAPLLDYPEFPGYETILNNALADLQAFEQGGADAVIFENNYDIPHKEFVTVETAQMMTKLGQELKKATKLPMGVNVLWNDYKNALAIAKELNLDFIRIPVFIDEIETRYGKIIGNPKEILEFQKSITAEDVALFTDIHVKHSQLLSQTTIEQAANLAVNNNSDGLIVTGQWTGDAPDYQELAKTQQATENFPIIIGSGADTENINKLFEYANAVIVSTSLKEGDIKSDQADNLKTWEQRISLDKVKNFITSIK